MLCNLYEEPCNSYSSPNIFMVFEKDEVIQGKVWFWVVANKAMNSGFKIIMLVLLTEW